MKARRILWAALFATAGWTAEAHAQNPAAIAQAAGAPPVAVAGAATAPTAATQPSTLWSFLGLSKEQKKACREQCCATPCGQFINKMMMPVTAFGGGIIGPFCPLTPSAAELADEGAVGDAAKIKAEEAQAKARRAAMRYLGTVDCVRFPNAKDALIKGLRGDTNECVRYEAALALGNGCCCNSETIEALTIAASCDNRDGNPRETSDRVRAAAASALARCLSCFVAPPKPAEVKTGEGKTGESGAEPIDKPKETPIPPVPAPTANSADGTAEKAAKAQPRPVGMAYYAKIAQVPRHLIVAEGQRVLDKYNQNHPPEVVQNRDGSVASALNRAFDDSGPMYLMENGLPVARAEIISQRPQTLWEVVTKPAYTGPVMPRDVGPNLTVEPPTAVVSNAPMPINIAEPMMIIPAKPEPMPARVVIKSEPVAPKAITKLEPMNRITMAPAEPPRTITPGGGFPAAAAKPVAPGPYGERTVYKAKTNAELASGLKTPASVELPAALPRAVVGSPDPTTPKIEVRQTLKPAEPRAAIGSPAPVAVKTSATPIAHRALTVFNEKHPAAVRESIADTLAPSDLSSSPELVTALVGVAQGTEAETTRKAAIRALVRCNVDSNDVTTALEQLMEDKTPSIRVEAAIGLARLKVGK